jgi:hypothetical protein
VKSSFFRSGFGHKRRFALLGTIVVLSVAGLIISYRFFQFDTNWRGDSVSSDSLIPLPSIQEGTVNSGDGLITYFNPEIGISFQYPNWLGETVVRSNDYTGRNSKTYQGKSVSIGFSDEGNDYYYPAIRVNAMTGLLPGNGS